jgi:hypothetical protein
VAKKTASRKKTRECGNTGQRNNNEQSTKSVVPGVSVEWKWPLGEQQGRHEEKITQMGNDRVQTFKSRVTQRKNNTSSYTRTLNMQAKTLERWKQNVDKAKWTLSEQS